MNTEEKAKAYDEVLKTATQWIEDGCSDKEKICLESVFPELRESEDERIRRTLVEYFGPGAQLDFIRGVPIQKIRDWLEKQKEQKSAEWSEEDDWKRKELIQYLEEKGDYRTVWMTWLKSLRPSWKPSEEQMEALEYVIRDYREDSCNATANYLQEILDHLKNM